MKKFSTYIHEVSEPKQYNKPLTDGGGGGGPSLKSLTGVNMPPDDIVAAGIAGSGGEKLNAMGLQKYQKPSLAARTTKTVKDTAYDIVNKPHPFNPLTAKDLGTEKATARYHADKIYQKQTGKEVPKSTDIGNKDVNQAQLTKDRNKLSDIESDLAKRGYTGVTPKLDYVKIGSNVGSPVSTKMPKPDPAVDVKKVVDKTSLDAARLGAVQALEITRDKREKRNQD